MTERNEDPTDLLVKWFGDSSWMSCQVEDTLLKIRKIDNLSKFDDAKTERQKTESANFAWLNNIDKEWKDRSMEIPLMDGEHFCTETEDTEIEWNPDVSEELVVLETTQIDGNDCECDEDEEENEKLLPLFISMILCSKEHDNGLVFDSLIIRYVSICGTVVGNQILNWNHILIVDDGTGVITCCIEDFPNDDLNHEEDDDDSLEGQFSEIFQFFRKKTKEYKYCLPTFDQIDLGDKVYITGKVSLYKNKHYLFVETLERLQDMDIHISFIDDVLHSFGTSYSDFGDVF